MKNKFNIFLLLILLSFTGCYYRYQISSINHYNGNINNESNKCLVIRTSNNQIFNNIINSYNDKILGDSYVRTIYSYKDIEAGYDCMKLGASTVLVYDNENIALSEASKYLADDYTNKRSYNIVFFDSHLPISGIEFTYSNYINWLNNNSIWQCYGCELINR